MDQPQNGQGAPQINGAVKGHSTRRASGPATQIPHALEIIHNPRSSNALRQEASLYLEDIKSDNEAPYHGFALASEKSQSAVVRHYGLSLLEHAIRHRWIDYTSEQSALLRGWILNLAQSVADDEPLYLRNKIGQLWVEVAKRSWVLEWLDMDQLLVQLWEGVTAQKELVLVVLETLSEDIFGHEDTAAGLRGTELNKACVEIFTPARVLTEHFPSREISINVRYGEEGWLSRMSDLLEWYTTKGQESERLQECVVAILSTLRSVMAWAIPRALVVTDCVQRICACLASSNLAVQLASVDALYALYSRTRFQEDDFRDLVCPMYGSKIINLLQHLYEWTIVDVNDLDEDKYLLSKKFSEMVFNIGRFLEERPALIPQDSDLSSFFNLLLSILRNQSLHVSIPILHLWTKLLKSASISNLTFVAAVTGDLLEVCSQRLLKYEALPEDSTMPSIVFLNEDVDNIPERHAFLGNYSRFCNEIVGIIVQKQPFDALYHILGQADQVLSNLFEGEPAFQVRTYTKNSIPLLRLDAQFTVVEAALKGYARWMSNQAPHHNHEQDVMNGNLQTWCERLLGLTFEDPLIKQRVIQLAGELATGPLKRNPGFVLKVFEFTLRTHCSEEPNADTYNDAVKDLQNYCSHQLQKLAMKFPDYLINVYNELETKLNEVFTDTTLDAHNRVRYSSVLFIITHRASTVDAKLRETRLDGFLQPTIGEWQSTELSNALSSFGGFCDVIGLSHMQRYFTERAVHNIQDWPAHSLDDEGLSLRAQMQDAFERLPLKTTKTLLSVSVEKLDRGSRTYTIACNIWQDKIPLLLPNLLQFLRHAHAFHDPSNWTELPEGMRNTVGRVLTDRFWQVGISSGTRDDFYATVGGTRATLEGLASSIRATMRGIRESCYRLLYYMSLLGDNFYGYDELPEPLSQALFSDACSLSTHQMAILVDMIRPVIEHCPSKHRPHFVGPMLATLFVQIDRKTGMEWDRIEEKNRSASEDDNLADEMRDESILRQLTFTAVMMVVGLLDPSNKLSPSDLENVPDTARDGDINLHLRASTMRFYILSTPTVLKPIILFCTHALRVRDTRACSLVTRVMRSLVSEFSSDSAVDAEVREFISTEVLKACITSLHEPYFVDLQKELAQLIASIITLYGLKTETPREILLSLPGIPADKVDHVIRKILKTQNSRHQRALVLDLLEGLRGISISEQGKIAKADPKKIRSALQQRYMTVDVQQQGDRDETPDLGGVAEMFG